MKRFKIVIVSGSFFPENSPRAFRTTELAVELARQGHDISVYFPTKGIDYSRFEFEHNLKIISLGELKWKGVKLRGNLLELKLRRTLRRGLQMFFEWPDIELMFKVYKAFKNIPKCDLIISIAVPHPIHWGVAKARSRLNKIAEKWVADCGDPYMGDAVDSFRKLFYFKYIEKWFCRKADFITIPVESAKSAYYPEFHNKIKIIPQGFRIDKIVIPDFKKVNDCPYFAYAGGFIKGKRDPGPLLKFLSEYNQKFKFIVYTSQPEILMPFTKLLGEKLEIRNPIPREELLKVLATMDFLINLDNNITTQVPSKLIDYAIAGRPILNLTSELDYTNLIDFMNGNYRNKMKLDCISNFDIKLVASDFLKLLNQEEKLAI